MADQHLDPELVFEATDQSKTKDFAFLAKLREKGAAVRVNEHFVFTAGWQATYDGFRDAKTYSSVGDMRAPGVVVPEEESFLGEIDAPLHPRIRRLLLRGFTPNAAAEAEPWTRASVRRRLLEIKDAGQGDLMGSLGYPLPGSVAAHSLGLPDEIHDQVMAWCNDLLHSTWPTHGRTDRGEGIAGAFPELAATLDEHIAARRTPRDGDPKDLLALMVQTVDSDGWRLSEHHIRTLAVNMLAGSFSASFMVGNLLYRYLDPSTGFEATLRERPDVIPAAVDESLRLEAPVVFLFRTARGEGGLGGCPVHQGDHIMLGIMSGNRDETVYRDAETFRLDREGEPEHLSFGAGAHLCLGNHLTRMIGRVILEEIMSVFPAGSLRLADGFQWECVDHMLEYGPERLDVAVVR